MRKTIIRYLAAALVVTMSTSLAACTNQASSNKSNEDSQTKIKVFGNFNDALKTSSPKTQTEKAMNAWYALLEEKNGIKLDLESPPASNYSERLQIMIAGGEYPDVIAFPDQNDNSFRTAVKNGIVIPVNPYLEKASNLMAHTLDISWEALKVNQDDKIYGIPRSTVMRADGFQVRKDWLDKLGLSIPEDGTVTLDEFTEILTKFTKNDPDGNGLNDTYGLGHFLNAKGYLEPAVLYPFQILGWQKHEGKYQYMDEKYCLEHDNYTDALKYSADLFQNGFMDPDSFTMKSQSASERFYKGVTGVMPGFSLHTAGSLQKIAANIPGAELTYITGIKNKNGEIKGTMLGTGFFWFWSISKSAKNPEKIVQMFDWILSDEGWDTSKHGLKDMNYTEDASGNKTPIKDESGAVVQMNAGKNFLRRAGDYGVFLTLGIPDNEKPLFSSREKWLQQCMNNFIPSLDYGFKPAVASNQGFIEAEENLDKCISKIIAGEVPVEEYKAELKEWYDAGGADYITQMNQYISK